MFWMRRQFILALAIAAASVGCGKSSAPTMKVYPVTGKLTVSAKPVEGLFLSLVPKSPLADTHRVPSARVEADGSFKIHTYGAADGAPAGAYALLVSFGPGQGQANQKLRKVVEAHSSLRCPAAEIVVKDGDNVLDEINLQ